MTGARRLRAYAWPLAFVAGAAACESALDERCVELAVVAERMLPPIVDGATTLAELAQALGAPAAEFEGGRVRGWALLLVEPDLRVDVDDDGMMQPSRPIDRGSGAARSARREALAAQGALRVVTAADVAGRALWPTWREAEYHLLVVDDGSGRVGRHAVLRVLP
jgi:hypothetical protein